MKTRLRQPALVFLFSVGISTLGALGADWPQWRGPDRNDVSQEAGLLKTWPAGGPKLLWTCSEAGLGFSGPAIVGNRLFTMGAKEDKEYVCALDVETGKKTWSTEVGNLLTDGRGDGPRGTPTVDGDVLYTIGGQGNLASIEIATGKKRWSKSLTKDLGGKTPTWGFAESPLVDGDRVVCSPGGSQGTLAALDKKSGKTLWQSKEVNDPAGYSSIIVAEVGGIKQYVQMTMKGVVGVAPEDGKVLWHYLQNSYRTAVIPTPIFHNNHVYATAGYGAGCDLLKLTPEGQKIKVEKVYANTNMVNHHGGVVLVGDHLYGYSDGKGWVCQEFKTGKNDWEEKGKLSKGCLTYADGNLYCYSERDGTVVLAEATPKGWKENGRFKIPKETELNRKRGQIWTHPVVANGRLYLRDQDLIFCFDVRNTAQSRK
ncbi:MAG TPA: PQQ-binding-like beta-propeller repeat protein [Gemmataceae bacterium]|jgi:outer membrane protein assembly factor BamB|nr:PQQ-binding-like beta-propeller repeat protein [Gemmataceae bacterium]